MLISILGGGCANCINLEKVAKEAVSDLGLEAEFDHITDYGEIASHGVMKTPGLMVDGEVVMSGRVPTTAQVRELLAPYAG